MSAWSMNNEGGMTKMTLNKSKGNMYDFVTHTWNVVKGKCPHDCEYCYMKIFKQHPLHLAQNELLTDLGSDNFIFVGSSCDMFANDVPDEWIKKILGHCNKYQENKYLFQTKNPERIIQFKTFIPKNSVIGTTIETNKTYSQMGKTPTPLNRAGMLAILKGMGFETMITIEPIMQFDLVEFTRIIHIAKPKWVNIGADSKGHNLPEPSMEDVRYLVLALKLFTVVRKKNNLGRLGVD